MKRISARCKGLLSNLRSIRSKTSLILFFREALPRLCSRRSPVIRPYLLSTSVSFQWNTVPERPIGSVSLGWAGGERKSVRRDEKGVRMEEIEMARFQKDTARIIEGIVSSKQAVPLKDRERVLVKILPVVPDVEEAWFGCMRDKGKVMGDIVSPVEDEENWKVFSE